MTRRPTTRAFAAGALSASAAVLFGLLAAAGAVYAQTASSGRPVVLAADDAATWRSLTSQQRQTLAPLEAEWARIERERRLKWIAIANRFPMWPAAERERITNRMGEWARMSPAERNRARQVYEEARQVPLSDRQARWELYQTLPVEERRQFEQNAMSRRGVPPPPVRRADADDAPRPKANIVPNPAFAERPRAVAPTIVRAAPGATTRPLGQSPVPPAHQQAGMPKIATTPEFVNRTTLLPRRGPQAAAVVPVPPSGPPERQVPPPPRTRQP